MCLNTGMYFLKILTQFDVVFFLVYRFLADTDPEDATKAMEEIRYFMAHTFNDVSKTSMWFASGISNLTTFNTKI